VLSDRFMDSTRAYQGAGGSLSDGEIDALEALVVGPTRPDLTVILDLEARGGLTRANLRQAATQAAGSDRDPFEARDLAFHDRLRQGFLAIAAREPNRCAVVDASQSADIVAASIRELVVRRFGPL